MMIRIGGVEHEATFEAEIELNFCRGEGVWLLDQITRLLEQDGGTEFALRISPEKPPRERQPLFPVISHQKAEEQG